MCDRLLDLNFSPLKQMSAATGLFNKIGRDIASSHPLTMAMNLDLRMFLRMTTTWIGMAQDDPEVDSRMVQS